jgi:hypothetical protein
MTTWRVGTTYPHAGKVNVYRKEFRCQHRTDRRRRGQHCRSSKNTNCPAKIEILVRRYGMSNHWRNGDSLSNY